MIRRGQTGHVPRRLAGPLAWVTLATILSGCQVPRPSAVERPTATEVAAALPKDAKIDQIVYADLTGDGRDEVLVAATLPDQRIQTLRRVMAFVFAPGRRGQYTPVLERDVIGDGSLPIQIERPAAEEAAHAVVRLVASPEERARRGQAGRERMGSPGAGARLAAALRAIAAELPTAARR